MATSNLIQDPSIMQMLVATAIKACGPPVAADPLPPGKLTFKVLILPPHEATVHAWITAHGGTCVTDNMIADVTLNLSQLDTVLAQPGVIRFRRPG